MRLTERSWALMKRVPRGRVVTYAEVARALNSNAHRAIGSAMRKNKSADVPCHRAIRSDGDVGEFNRGRSAKIRLLKGEGIA